MWLNNPRRPQEACGTSGMKAALNGGLNLSILDGWWDECFDGENGWAISSAEHEEDLERRDEVEAGSLFELLERQVVPLFYERWQGPVPRRWVQRVKRSLITLGPFVTAARMVRDYTEQLYEPTAAAGRRAAPPTRYGRGPRPGRVEGAGGRRAGPASTSTTSTCRRRWPSSAPSARSRPSSSLGDLGPDDVEVQLIHGPAGQGAELTDTTIVPMTAGRPGRRRPPPLHRAASRCEQAGRYGVTVRIVPPHPDLVTPLELGLIAWG